MIATMVQNSEMGMRRHRTCVYIGCCDQYDPEDARHQQSDFQTVCYRLERLPKVLHRDNITHDEASERRESMVGVTSGCTDHGSRTWVRDMVLR